MSNSVQARIDQAVSELRPIVEATKYIMPGWRVFLGGDNEDPDIPALHVISYTIDAYHPERMSSVNHSFLVPLGSYNARNWKIWIRDCIAKVWEHEINEMLLFNGVREFAPHHGNGEDPYRTWLVGDLADTQVRAGETKDGD